MVISVVTGGGYMCLVICAWLYVLRSLALLVPPHVSALRSAMAPRHGCAPLLCPPHPKSGHGSAMPLR
jgi:hypothetical protein